TREEVGSLWIDSDERRLLGAHLVDRDDRRIEFNPERARGERDIMLTGEEERALARAREDLRIGKLESHIGDELLGRYGREKRNKKRSQAECTSIVRNQAGHPCPAHLLPQPPSAAYRHVFQSSKGPGAARRGRQSYHAPRRSKGDDRNGPKPIRAPSFERSISPRNTMAALAFTAPSRPHDGRHPAARRLEGAHTRTSVAKPGDSRATPRSRLDRRPRERRAELANGCVHGWRWSAHAAGGNKARP